jgi:hypothetical protein
VKRDAFIMELRKVGKESMIAGEPPIAPAML